MPKRTSKTGSELFIVDNSDELWKVRKYRQDWCPLSKSIDIATGYFEIGSLLALDGEWPKVDAIRILMGDEVTKRTQKGATDWAPSRFRSGAHSLFTAAALGCGMLNMARDVDRPRWPCRVLPGRRLIRRVEYRSQTQGRSQFPHCQHAPRSSSVDASVPAPTRGC